MCNNVPVDVDEYRRLVSKREWQGLTQEERNWLRKRNQKHDDYAKAVEALLKEKNQ